MSEATPAPPRALVPTTNNGPSAIAPKVPKPDHTAGRSIDRLAFEPGALGEAADLAVKLHESGLFPVKNPQTVLALLLKGRELGFTAMQSLESIYVVEGRPALAAQGMLALVINSGLAEYLDPIELSAEKCTWETKRQGARNPVKITWTIEDARRAGLSGKKVWTSYPRTMLSNRALSELIRLVYPDVIRGLHTPEELRDGLVIDVTPEPVPAAEKPRGVEEVKARVVTSTSSTSTSSPAPATLEGADVLAAARAANPEPPAPPPAPSPPVTTKAGKSEQGRFALAFTELERLVGREQANEIWQKKVGVLTGKTKEEKLALLSVVEREIAVIKERLEHPAPPDEEPPPAAFSEGAEPREPGADG